MPGTAEAKRAKRAAAKAKAAAADAPVFRLCRKQSGMTWSCPSTLDENGIRVKNPIPNKETIKDDLTDRFGAAIWTVCSELHKDGATHYHAHFKFDKELNTEDPKCFDVCGVHPNIVKGGPGWENYVRKQGEFITNKTACEFAVAMAMDTPKEALEHLWEHKTQDMCKHGEAIERNVRRRMAPEVVYYPYNGPYEHWCDWDHSKFSLLIWGPAGGGKTQYARWLLAHKFGGYTYVKKSHEELKKISFEKPLLFDEVYLIDKEAEMSREITDVENGGSVACRNADVLIPPGVPRVFLSNYQYPFKNPREAVYGRRLMSLYYDQGFVDAEKAPEVPERSDAAKLYDPTGVLAGIC